MIPDLQIVDPVPTKLEFSPTNPDNPYTISYTLPAGAPEPPEVVYTPVYDDAGKVVSLRWEFPGWDFVPGAVVTVGVEFKLAPGAQVGDKIENRAGATGARPDLACSPGGSAAGTVTDDDACGPGTYCTSAEWSAPSRATRSGPSRWAG